MVPLKQNEIMQQMNALRAELKKWEKEFSVENNGVKASRDDIKKRADIAAKYKEYNRMREVLAEKSRLADQSSKCRTPRRRNFQEMSHDESNQPESVQTPSAAGNSPWKIDPYDSPSVVRSLFTPSRKSLAPTPQKEGKVLGLFDLLADEEGTITPKRKRIKQKGGSIPCMETVSCKSDSVQAVAVRDTTVLTPSRKHQVPDSYVTPSKTRSQNNLGVGTPVSVSKYHPSTPSFLRRDHRLLQPVLEIDEESLSLPPRITAAVKKPQIKSLSSILADLRNVQEAYLDEDLEALRDMEAEEYGYSQPLARPKQKPADLGELTKYAEGPKITLNEDSATIGSNGGSGSGQEKSSQAVKIFKKKGQKRTTRKVKMKPTRPMLASSREAGDVEKRSIHPALSEGQENNVDQLSDSARNFDSDTQSEYTASEGETRYRRPKSNKTLVTADGRSSRRVGAVVHQNYKRLKLRNSGAKGQPACSERFRRKKK
ncbi:BgTH12-02765 [Blumeria graminis f. sp. triticale]|uniref:DNA replication regulator SLD2 n=1 Tax=Blumeria graminis f. sp. triticale TaxID=1689686 RepID=A0A9W4DN56_BLUGR|nr:BgTH12-02765 [Blumeria graminis f. sp. triticale]